MKSRLAANTVSSICFTRDRARAILCCLLLVALPGALRAAGARPGKNVVVQSKFGGEIFGYDVDRNGTEGIFSEAAFLPDGNLLIATETFDQRTGKIIKVVHKKTETQDNFVTLGVVGDHVGLNQTQHVEGGSVAHRTYNTVNPLDGNKITGNWTPPLHDKKQLLEDVEGDQGNPNVAVMASQFACCNRFVFGSDVTANTFGPFIHLTDDVFNGGVPPMLAFDSKNNRAVVAQAEGSPFSFPKISLVDLTSTESITFNGLGFGYVNGLALDSATGRACTTTETDNSAEFYSLEKQRGILVALPNIGQYSGGLVAVDPLHKLFLITHPVPGADGQIHVFTEKGKLLKSLFGFPMGPAGAYLALNPTTRTGFLLAPGNNQNFSALQSFTY